MNNRASFELSCSFQLIYGLSIFFQGKMLRCIHQRFRWETKDLWLFPNCHRRIHNFLEGAGRSPQHFYLSTYSPENIPLIHNLHGLLWPLLLLQLSIGWKLLTLPANFLVNLKGSVDFASLVRWDCVKSPFVDYIWLIGL